MNTLSNPPEHVAFIMDGNRRWAKGQGLEKKDGHKAGADKAEDIVEWCVEWGIKHITLWALSTENWKVREKLEVDAIFGLIAEIPKRFKKLLAQKVQLDFIGQRDTLPKHVQESLNLIDRTMQIEDPKHHLHIAINYGGQTEIIDAVKAYVKENTIETLTPEKLSTYMYTKDIPDPELIIRTGGHKRLSGFMSWQSGYSEWAFLNTYWPDLSREEVYQELQTFEHTPRNFGK